MSTPMRTSRATKSGAVLKAVSPAMLRLLATRLPDRNDKRRFPSFTVRPRPADNRVSSVDRNVFASMKNGVATTATNSSPSNTTTVINHGFILRSPAADSSRSTFSYATRRPLANFRDDEVLIRHGRLDRLQDFCRCDAWLCDR